MARVSVIIVNYNSGDRLGRCLASLRGQTFRDFETIVIDNASHDHSLAAARAIAPDALFLDAGANLGFAGANNRAAAQARGEWLAFLNPDAYPAPDWLDRLIAASGRHPGVDAFGSTQLNDSDPTRLDGAGDAYHVFGIAYRGHFGWPAISLPAEGECFAPCAAAALYRTAAFQALGGFDERFFCYCEDVDLGFRLRLAGGRAIQVRDAIVRHEGSGVTGRYSEFSVYHGHRNRIWTAWKNMPGVYYWPLLPLQILANAVLFWRAWSIGRGAAYWRAMKGGYGGLAGLAADRARIQRHRQVGLRALGRAFVWSPFKLARREEKRWKG